MKYLIVLILSSLILLSCSEGPLTGPGVFSFEAAAAGVKSKVYYPRDGSNQILSIEDFKYDRGGRLIKKSYYGGDREMLYNYELFVYGRDTKLVYKLNYHSNINSPTGFILLDSTVYSYSGNLLISEKKTLPQAAYYDESTYEYKNSLLVKKTNYHRGAFDSYIVYEYMDGILSKETNFYKNGSITESLEYNYRRGILTGIIYYNSIGEAKRKVTYTYGDNGKIAVETVDELFAYSSAMPYVVRYFYGA